FIREASDVHLVKGSIDFVEDTEGGRSVLEDRQHQRYCGHGLFAARQQKNVLKPLSGRLGNQIDSRLEYVVFVNQNHLAAAAAKELNEHLLKILVDVRERMPEPLPRPPFDLGKRLLGHLYRVQNVGTLRAQELESLFRLFQLFERHHVDWTHVVDLGPQFLKPASGRFDIQSRRQRGSRHRLPGILTFTGSLVAARFGIDAGIDLTRGTGFNPRFRVFRSLLQDWWLGSV